MRNLKVWAVVPTRCSPILELLPINEAWIVNILAAILRGAAIAQWIHLRLQSWRFGFESQAHHLCFYQIIFELWLVEKTIINKKRPRLGPFKKHTNSCSLRLEWHKSRLKNNISKLRPFQALFEFWTGNQQLTVNTSCCLKNAADYFWTQVLRDQRQPLCQLCHIHCSI